MLNFQDQIVVVTGASRGIGKGIAHAFAEAGATVACVATTLEGAAKTAAELPKAHAFAADVSKSEDVEKLISDIQSTLGTPHVLVNNAGVTRDTLILRMKEEDWDQVIDVNLKGAFLMIKGFAKIMMKERYGRIVNLSSVIGIHGAAGQANYAASKAGIIGLTISTAKEFGSRGITCNAVAPGFIESDMTSTLPEDFRDHVVKNAPAGRLGKPADVANSVLFLASREAEYITGQVLVVDGGLML